MPQKFAPNSSKSILDKQYIYLSQFYKIWNDRKCILIPQEENIPTSFRLITQISKLRKKPLVYRLFGNQIYFYM